MAMTISEARQLFDKVTSHGGKVPPELRALVDLDTRVRSIQTTDTAIPLTKLAALSDTDLEAGLHDAAMSRVREDARGDLVRRLDVEIPAAIINALKGGAGEVLLKSLRPVVARHAEGLDRVALALPEQVTAEQVLEMGPDAAAAWREGPVHARALDDILWHVAMPIATKVLSFNPLFIGHASSPFIAFMIDLTSGADPDGAAERYTAGRDQRHNRFSGWRSLQTVASIRLNTVAEVQAHLGEIHATKYAAATATLATA